MVGSFSPCAKPLISPALPQLWHHRLPCEKRHAQARVAVAVAGWPKPQGRGSAVIRLAYRQTEGLIGSVIGLLGLTLRVPDHATLSRRAATLEVPQPQRQPGAQAEALHLLVDSTGLKLCGAGEWLVEKHGPKTRRAWRKLHIGLDAGTGQMWPRR